MKINKYLGVISLVAILSISKATERNGLSPDEYSRHTIEQTNSNGRNCGVEVLKAGLAAKGYHKSTMYRTLRAWVQTEGKGYSTVPQANDPLVWNDLFQELSTQQISEINSKLSQGCPKLVVIKQKELSPEEYSRRANLYGKSCGVEVLQARLDIQGYLDKSTRRGYNGSKTYRALKKWVQSNDTGYTVLPKIDDKSMWISLFRGLTIEQIAKINSKISKNCPKLAR